MESSSGGLVGVVMGLPQDVVEGIHMALCWVPEAALLEMIAGAIRERLEILEAQGEILVHPSSGSVIYKPAGSPYPAPEVEAGGER